MDNQYRPRSTGQGTRATHGPYATNRSDNSGRFLPKESFPREKESRSEKDLAQEEKLRNFRDLKVWQTAKRISVAVYKITQRFPQEELYGLSSQMRRAAISISSNIAEGFNRYYKRDYQRFLMIALGSCGELESQIEVGSALGYLSKETFGELLETLDHENRMLRKLHSKLKEDLQSRHSQIKNRDVPLSANNPAPLQY